MPPKNSKPTETTIRKRYILYLAAAILIALILATYLLFVSPAQPKEPKAAIIDQLASTKLAQPFANPTFVNETKRRLYQHFSIIDYYLDNATVENYRHLASAGYKLIIWRTHSALNQNSSYIAISTTDKQGQKNYDQYLDNDQLNLCKIDGDPDLYFGITPSFIEQVMVGKFEDTVIVLMSCNGLSYDRTAKAFEEKGVRVFISWNGWILPSDNDIGAGLLLQYLIDENLPVGSAVSKIPYYLFSGLATYMKYYPYPDASDYRIPDYRKITEANSISTTAAIYVRIKKQWDFRIESVLTGS